MHTYKTMKYIRKYSTHQTKNGSKNCITITNPRVISISARFNSNIKQHKPLVFGQNGFGADMVSITTPRFLSTLVRTDVEAADAGRLL